MTALTVTARPEGHARLRPVPWRRIAWVTWRQHRAALLGVAAFLAAIAVFLVVSGLQIHHAFATDCRSVNSLACNINFDGKFATTVNVVRVFLQVVPAVIGAFVAAPVLAREMETGTFRYAWTQGFGRWRWALGKLVLLAAAVTAAAAAFSVLFAWYMHPFFAANYTIPFATDGFDLGEVAFPGWTLVTFAAGGLVGMLIRRVVPAIAATMAVYAGLALAAALYLRQHYMAPLLSSSPNLPASAWSVNQWFTKDGKFAFPARGSALVQTVDRFCPPRIGSNYGGPAQCLSRHGYVAWSAYQPGSRYWAFQWIEGGWLLALSVLLIAATVWLVRRRAT
jgi:ABC-type transport system involved in multi-copper enzyme maturation permease subunit